jgi:hypothetical protein
MKLICIVEKIKSASFAEPVEANDASIVTAQRFLTAFGMTNLQFDATQT